MASQASLNKDAKILKFIQQKIIFSMGSKNRTSDSLFCLQRRNLFISFALIKNGEITWDLHL